MAPQHKRAWRAVPIALAIVAMFALHGPAVAGHNRAPGTSPTPPADEIAVQANAATGAAGVCDIRVDVSLSIDDTTRARSLDEMSGMLETIIGKFQCRTLRVSAFTASGFPISMGSFDMAPPPKPAICDPPRSTGPMCKVYPAYCTHPSQVEIDRCVARNDAGQTAWQNARSDTLAALRHRLHAFRTQAETSPCTAIYESAAYGLARARHVIVVTDGDSDCRWPAESDGEPKTVKVHRGASLVFLLVRSKDDPSGDLTLARSLKAQRIFPGSIAAPIEDALANSFWSAIP